MAGFADLQDVTGQAFPSPYLSSQQIGYSAYTGAVFPYSAYGYTDPGVGAYAGGYAAPPADLHPAMPAGTNELPNASNNTLTYEYYGAPTWQAPDRGENNGSVN